MRRLAAMSSSRVDLILRQLDVLRPLPASAARALEQSKLRSHEAAARVLKRLRPKKSAAQLRWSADLTMHSLAVACAAELLAERLSPRSRGGRPNRASSRTGKRPAPAEAFCCGLLHDIGKLALLAVFPRSYARVIRAADSLRTDIADIERQIIGIDHHAAGRHLADQWRLPAPVGEVIRLHNQRPEHLPATAAPDASMIALVTLADSLARAAHVGYSGNFTFGVPHEELMAPLKLRQADLDFCAANLIDRVGVRWAELGLGKEDAGALYRSALRRSGAELAQSQQRLESQSQSQQSRQRCLAALSGMQLNPDASVADVLGVVAQTTAHALNCGAVAAFAVAGGGTAQVLLLEHDGSMLHNVARTGALRVPRPEPAGDGTNPIQPAGDDLEWLMNSHGPRLRGARRWRLLLESEGRTIGGLVWGGGADEADRLAPQSEALVALCVGCSLALRMAQVREQATRTAEQLAETNRRLAMAQDQIARDRAVLCVAELAAGAAHEMNNPLMVISGRSQLLYRKLADEGDRQAALAIHQNAQRLSDMITSLMRFARPAAAEPQAIEVSELFARAMSLIAELPERQGRHIECIVPPLPAVQADSVQIARALAALLENALQATEAAGGHIEVNAGLDVAQESLIITILDNGVGMDAATLQRAFDPFFSAKPAGRRRGMGLPVALRLIEANGGSLRLDSRLGAGTRAVVTLPVAPALAQAAAPARRSA